MADAEKELLRPGTSIREVKGVGPRRADCLARLGINTVSDLLRHLPVRYEAHAAEGNIGDLPMNAVGSARGTVVAARVVGVGTRSRFQVTLQDHSNRLDLVWFNASYLGRQIHAGMLLRVQGKVVPFNGYAQMVNPKWERLDGQPVVEPAPNAYPGDDIERLAARIRPVYAATEDLPSQQIEKFVTEMLPLTLPNVVDPLPADLLSRLAMPSLAEAFRMAHQPKTEDEHAAARRRLAFNELLLLQLGIVLKRHHNETAVVAPELHWSGAIDKHIRDRFPFALTPAQERVVKELSGDLQRKLPMNRLLQGDVGSGKTIVALYALLMAVANRQQGAIMAPTELLAEQHYLSMSNMLAGSNVKIVLLTSSAAERKESLVLIEEGKADIVVGTQALLTQSVKFKSLAVVVVDEQHRFGVMQRAQIRSQGMSEESGPPGSEGVLKKMKSPHCLVMTATPIPRTLSLTLFGDLDISTIDELPPGRTPIVTRVVGEEKSDEVYRYLAKRVAEGGQAYVVVPTIEEGGDESPSKLKSVNSHAKLIEEKFCRPVGATVAVVHGQLKAAERDAVMQKFRKGEIGVLVATTVIEVGVDVPNASIMVVEHADRFGLAQLHQLRGRIGRGTQTKKPVCVFVAQPTTEVGLRRMAAIAGTTDGFKIAEEDLAIRGMGEFFGTRQHGVAAFRAARIPEDVGLLRLARSIAQEIVREDPRLALPARARLRAVLLQQYGDSLGLADVA